MAKQFKVGDKVKIATTSQYYTGGVSHNPRDTKGTIIEVNGTSGFKYRVEWNATTRNSYRDGDLVPFKQPKEKDMAGKEKLYVDVGGDLLEVDTLTATDSVYFTTADEDDGTVDDGCIFKADVETVKKIRKQLTKWLDNNGHRV